MGTTAIRSAMFSTRRVSYFALSATVLLALSGCALLEPDTSDNALTGVELCALGHTWALDTADLATQVNNTLASNGVTLTSATIEGTQTITWDVKSAMEITSDYTITLTSAPAADQVITVVQTHRGTATGKAYISADVAIPRTWNTDDLTVDTVADNNGTALEDMPYTIPNTDFDDSVGLELTCDGDVMTVHPRGGQFTQTWTKTD